MGVGNLEALKSGEAFYFIIMTDIYGVSRFGKMDTANCLYFRSLAFVLTSYCVHMHT